MITSNDNMVFLLGAGFSAHNGCPVMTGFMERARRNYFDGTGNGKEAWLIECFNKLLEFQSKCLRSAWAFSRNWENIEELYTQADLMRLCGLPQAGKLCQDISWAIWDVYRESKSPSGHLKGAVAKLCENGLVPIFVTTNYDTVIETSLDRPFHYPGFHKDYYGSSKTGGIWRHSLDKSVSDDSLGVIKLHGSSNWFQFGNGKHWVAIAPDADKLLLPSSKEFSKERLVNVIKEHILPMKKEDLVPAIIPPMLGKAAIHRAIQDQWRCAIEAMRYARQLWVIGYSFPATDSFMKRLLSQGLQDNHNLQQIVIIDKQLRPGWEARLIDMFPRIMLDTRVKFYSMEAVKAIEFIATTKWNRIDDTLSDNSRAYVASQTK